MYIYSREIQAAAGSFDYVRLTPHSAQDDRHVGCEGVQGVRRSMNFRPSNFPPSGAWTGHPFTVISPVLVMAVLATGDREREHLLG
jgi:hypothetical protein